MKRNFIIVICVFAACVGMNAAPVVKNLTPGETLKRNMKMSFSEEAIEDGAFISWELTGDWDKFDYSFSQGKLKGNVFTVNAADYKPFAAGEDGIALTIKGRKKTEAATYELSMKVKEVSDNLNFPREKMNLLLNVRYVLPPPPPIWQTLLVISAVLAVVGLLVALVLSQTAKFPRGLLQLGREEIELKGKKRISVRQELDKMGIELEGISDVIFVKKRFTSFQGPCIKQMTDCALECDGEFVSCGKVLLPTEELKGLKDAQGNEIIIRYC